MEQGRRHLKGQLSGHYIADEASGMNDERLRILVRHLSLEKTLNYLLVKKILKEEYKFTEELQYCWVKQNLHSVYVTLPQIGTNGVYMVDPHSHTHKTRRWYLQNICAQNDTENAQNYLWFFSYNSHNKQWLFA